MSEEIDLDDARKREILELERTLDTKSHFEMLGVEPWSTPEEIKRSFYELSRRFHPDRFYAKNLGSFRGRVERIFKRIAEANRVLSDEERRAAFLAEHPELARKKPPPPAAPPPPRSAPVPQLRAAPAPEPVPEQPYVRTERDDARDAERRARLSRHPYLAKAGRMNDLLARSKAHVARGDFGLAFADLNLAAQADPKNMEIQTLLADVRKKHDASRAEAELKRGAQAEADGDLNTAAAAYRLASTVDVASAKAAFKAAWCMQRLGADPKEIKNLAQRAADLEPLNADHQALLGNVLLALGMKKLAEKHLARALELDPANAEAKKQLKKGRWPF